MRFRAKRHALVLSAILAVALTTQPVMAFSTSGYLTDEEQAALAAGVADGDTKAVKSAQKWILIGGPTNVVGLLATYVYPVSVPAAEVAGKSPEYVKAYTETYKERNKARRRERLMVGCLVTTIGAIPLYFLAKSSDDKDDEKESASQ